MSYIHDIISAIKLPTNVIYDICDKEAIHKITSTDNTILRFDGTEGNIQDSVVKILDTGSLVIGGIWTGTSSQNPYLQLGDSITANQNARLTANNTGAFTFAPSSTPTFLATTTEFRPISNTAGLVDLGSASYKFRNIYATTGIYATTAYISKINNGADITIPTGSGVMALISDIPTTLSALTDDATHRLVTDTEKATWTGKQDALLFDSTPTINSTNPVTSAGIYTAIENVREVAEGKTTTYVVSTTDNPAFNSQNTSITLTSALIDKNKGTVALTSLKPGDVIYVTQSTLPDRWVGTITTTDNTTTVTCYILETAKAAVTDVRVNNSSVVANSIANIDLTSYAQSSNLATVATSGSYNDLTNKPTIPTNADYVDLTNNQTVNGVKTFTSRPLSQTTYTRIEYLQSNYSGSGAYPYIRTGVKRGTDWNNKLTTVLDGYFTISQTKGFCGYDSGGQIGQSNGKWSTEAGVSTISCVGVSNRATVKQEINTTTQKDTLYIDDTQIAQRSISGAATYAMTFDYPLFVASSGSSAAYSPAALVLYSFKMYNDENQLIRDFIPVQDSHGILGLLDLVHNEFYTNLGSGTFTAGPEGASIASAAQLLTSEDVGLAALSNSYNDLDNKPTIPMVGTIVTTYTTTQTTGSESLTGVIKLHKISKTGDYNDLLNKPTIPVIPDIPTIGSLDTTSTLPLITSASESFSDSISLHKISKTGSYTDLLNKPDIPNKTSDLTNDGEDGAHAFVDVEDILYSNSNGTTIAVGGIAKGTTFSNKSVLSILEDMLYPYVAFTFSSISTSAASGTFEYGTSKIITTVTPTFTKGSKDISLVKIGTSNGGSDLYTGSSANSGTAITITSLTLNGLSNQTIYCTIGDGTNTSTQSATFTFNKYTYYGSNTSTTTPTTSSGLTGANSVSSGVSITTTNNSYIWFLSPTSKTTIQQNAIGQWNNVPTTSMGTVTFTTSKNQSLTYYAYRSDKMSAATGTYRLN